MATACLETRHAVAVRHRAVRGVQLFLPARRMDGRNVSVTTMSRFRTTASRRIGKIYGMGRVCRGAGISPRANRPRSKERTRSGFSTSTLLTCALYFHRENDIALRLHESIAGKTRLFSHNSQNVMIEMRTLTRHFWFSASRC